MHPSGRQSENIDEKRVEKEYTSSAKKMESERDEELKKISFIDIYPLRNEIDLCKFKMILHRVKLAT